MNNYLSFILFFLLLATTAKTQGLQPEINMAFSQVLEDKNPLLLSTNPAAIFYNSIDSLAIAELNYSLSSGDYKATMTAQQTHNVKLHTESYYRLNKTMYYGLFSFAKEWLLDQNYTNNYNPYCGTPYIFADSIGGDQSVKEQYHMQAKAAHHFNQHITLGAEVDYQLGLAAQNSDPRAQNKTTKFYSNIGLLGVGKMLKLGLDAHYGYFNEDIDISVVKTNADHTLFALKGLGNYEDHTSTGFSRYYQHHAYGMDAQLQLYNNLLNIGTSNSTETSYDGRRKSNATWSAIKTDAQLRSKAIHIKDVYTIETNKHIHQISLSANKSTHVGSEYLQKLIQENDQYDTYQWVSLLKEDKYYRQNNALTFNYKLSNYFSDYLRNYSLETGLILQREKEEYNYLNANKQFNNLLFILNTAKLFRFQQHHIDFMFNFVYQYNYKNKYENKLTNFISENIIKPDFIYFSSNYFNAGCSIDYMFSTTNNKHYFISTSYKHQHSNHRFYSHKSRSIFNLRIGTMF